jgi:hypothetical protein
MLVVTANWALADGTLVAASRGRQAEFLEAVHRAALRSGVRRDGRYEPIDGITIVLAGDTFDPITSTAWAGGARPWHEGARAAGVAAAVMLAAAGRGRRLLAGLSAWARTGLLVPAADRRGRPVFGRDRRVPVRVTILPGDRDPWIAGAGARLARRGIEVAGAWSVPGITVCHGAELDPLWTAVEPGRPTLGASLAVDLVARFGTGLRGRPDLWPACRPLVAQLAAARALEMPGVVAEWLTGMERSTVALRDAWRAAVAGWRRQARIAEPVCDASFDSIDAVAAWMDALDLTLPAAAGDIAALLDPRPPVGAESGTVVFGHWSGAAAGTTIVGLGLAPGNAVDPAADVTLPGLAPARQRRGPAHVVFPDPDRPAVHYRLAAEDPLPRRAYVPPVSQRIVEAA